MIEDEEKRCRFRREKTKSTNECTVKEQEPTVLVAPGLSLRVFSVTKWPSGGPAVAPLSPAEANPRVNWTDDKDRKDDMLLELIIC